MSSSSGHLTMPCTTTAVDPIQETTPRRGCGIFEDLLSEGPKPAREVCEVADAEGISKRTLWRVNAELRVKLSGRQGRLGGRRCVAVATARQQGGHGF
jgi:hypothetical protein